MQTNDYYKIETMNELLVLNRNVWYCIDAQRNQSNFGIK